MNFSQTKFPLFSILVLCLLLFSNQLFSQHENDIQGVWKGSLQIEFLFKIDRSSNGALTATFHTPQQEVYNVPIKHVRFSNDSLYLGLELSDVKKSHFAGVLNREKRVIEGFYHDGVYDYPMTLTADKKLLAQMAPWIDSLGHRINQYHYTIPANLNDGWDTGHIADTGADTAKIFQVLQKIIAEDYKQIHSMLIVKDGILFLDEYFYGFSAQKRHFIASVTKSVTNALVGIAVDQGLIKDIYQPVCYYFPEHDDLICTPEKKRIQLYHLLSMSAGLEWDEQSYNYLDSRNSSVSMEMSGDGLRYLFERKLMHTPGEKFIYNSGLPVVLSEVIKKASGMTIDKFAEKYLFEPLGINDYFWEKLPDGTFHDGGGLHLKSHDMAKLGLLYMNRGQYRSKRILSESWFDNCSKRYLTGEGPEYWNHWSPHIEFINDVPVEIYSAAGLGGQFIYAMPRLNMIVIFTSDFFGFPNQMNEIMRNELVPAFLTYKRYNECQNFTSKDITFIRNYNWQYHWISEMACIEAGTKQMGIDVSPAWLFGSNGKAFLINIANDVSANGISDFTHNFENKPQPKPGFRLEAIESAADAPDFSAKQREAWDKIRAAIDNGYPCYGFHIDWAPEYYMIFGYDDIGYYYKGIDHYQGSGPKAWKDAGTQWSKRLSMKIMLQAEQDNEIEVIKNSLQFATEYYKQERAGNYTAGPAAYDVWINALQEEKANSYGNALNAVTWAECRRCAVEYLKECKTRLPQIDDALFDDAIASYQIVAQNLNSLAELFPFFVSTEMKDKALSDPVTCRNGIKFLKQAKEAEIAGIKSIALILEKL